MPIRYDAKIKIKISNILDFSSIFIDVNIHFIYNISSFLLWLQLSLDYIIQLKTKEKRKQ